MKIQHRPGWLMVADVVMYFITMAVIALRLSLPPIHGIIMLLCGLALLPGVFVLFLLIGEFLFPH